MKNKLIVFDCDGTILDTFTLIEVALRKTFEQVLPHINITTEELHSFFGPFLDESFRQYTRDNEELIRALDTYRKLTLELHPKYVRTFPNIPELLIALKEKGYQLAIVSNKLSSSIKYGLEINHIEDYFDYIVGAEMVVAAKPHPDGLFQALRHFKSKSCYFIGDTKYDIMAGKNANIAPFNVKTIGVTWCRSTHQDFKNWGADYIIDDPQEIIKIVEDEI